jgi:hypothetical protein
MLVECPKCKGLGSVERVDAWAPVTGVTPGDEIMIWKARAEEARKRWSEERATVIGREAEVRRLRSALAGALDDGFSR